MNIISILQLSLHSKVKLSFSLYRTESFKGLPLQPLNMFFTSISGSSGFPVAGIISCAFNTLPQITQWLPSVYPVSVAVGAIAGSIIGSCPVAEISSVYSSPQLQVYVLNPASVQVGFFVIVLSYL